jgi:hypothetical protein
MLLEVPFLFINLIFCPSENYFSENEINFALRKKFEGSWNMVLNPNDIGA